MAEGLLGFKSIDSTERINARLAGLIPKGVLKGGVVVVEPASLQVRVKGVPGEPWTLLAFTAEGMLVRDRTEHVLPVTAGITNVVVLRAKYLESQAPVISLEVMTLGAYQVDPEQGSLIRLASVTPPSGATSVAPEHIDLSFRDSVEGLRRNIVRGLVPTKEDLPSVSGFPATAEVNFIGNDFVTSTSVTVAAGLISEVFPIVPAISFRIASPTTPGLSRLNPSESAVVSAVEAALTGVVTVTTAAAHGFSVGNQIRISGSSAAAANGIWTVASILSLTSFTFNKAGSVAPFSSTGGSVVNTATVATVTVTLAPGVTHNLVVTQPIIITEATDPSFNVTSAVVSVPDAQTFTYSMTGYPGGDSGNGKVTKVGFSLPVNGVEIGETAAATAENFEAAFRASTLDPLVGINAIGSSLQLEAKEIGAAGNAYTLAKSEPGVLVGDERIVLSGSTFAGGADPLPGLAAPVDLQRGDIYEVLFGDAGTLELWGFDGVRFQNLTSASAGTLLDFHRRNLLLNEKHLTENEKAALQGSAGTPSATNPFVTVEDTSVISSSIAAALQGADNEAPSGSNRYLTEARYRGERGVIAVPGGFDLSIPAVNVNAVTDVITSAAHGLSDGFAVTISSSGTLPGNLLPSTTYYVVTSTTNDFQLSLTFGGSAIDITSSGTGTHTVTVPVQDWVKLTPERWVVGNEVDSAIQFFNVVDTDTLKDPGGPVEYTQQSFAPVTVDAFYVDVPFIPANELDPSDAIIGADSLGIYPKPEAAGLGNPTNLYVKLSAFPNNGPCSVLFTRAEKEKFRVATADNLAGPQRIIPASLRDVENKASELRFNTGIEVSGTDIIFPANLFVASNLQSFTFRRPVGGRIADLTSSFFVDFDSGTGTGGIVQSFTPVAFPAADTWTRYILSLTSSGKVYVYPLSEHLESASGVAFHTTLSSLSVPNLAFTKGEWAFASVGVKSNSTNTGIEDLEAVAIDLFPYQGTNSRDPNASIYVGDGTTTFGHFSGTTAHIRALTTAASGSRIHLLAGTYDGQWLINKDDISVTFDRGAVLQHSTPMISLSLAPADFNTGTFEITSVGHGLSEGHLVTIDTTGTLPLGLLSSVPYYVLFIDDDTFQLSLTAGGTPEAFTTQGTGTHTIETELVALNVNASGFHADGARFQSCLVGANLTQNATEATFVTPTFEGTVTTNFRGAESITSPALVTRGDNVATYVCTDGLAGDFVGDFNGPDALNDAHAAASAGDTIIVYPGIYDRITSWTKSQITLRGVGGSVLIDGAAANPAITVSGSNNVFENLVLQNATIGINCTTGAAFNIFAETVSFAPTVALPIRFPNTTGSKHGNHHPIVSGNLSTSGSLAVITCGDGVISWGDYVGSDAINQALAAEPPGVTLRVGKGSYEALTGVAFNDVTIVGSGEGCVIQATAPGDLHCIHILGSNNRVRGFHLEALNNSAVDFNVLGVEIDGSDNIVEHLSFTIAGVTAVVPHRRYKVTSGARNRFIPHSGSPAGYVSWTVGDGKRSVGDFTSITTAIAELPTRPRGINGDLSNVAGDEADFEDFTVPAVIEYLNTADPYYVDALNRHITVSSGLAGNQGSFKIVSVLSGSAVRLKRFDGGTFTAQSGLVWDLLAGAKIWVLPGTYSPFTLDQTKNDIDLEAWGDVIVTGPSPEILVGGSRNRISGFRFEGAGTGIQVDGHDNIFENNVFNTPTRYTIGANARRNRILDAPENSQKTAYTVSTLHSRGDFVGNDQAAIQAAVDAAALDPQIKRVVIGAGVYTLTSTVTVPADVTVLGSGYGTHVTGGIATGFTLAGGGNQTVSGIRFSGFATDDIGGTAAGVVIYGNWLPNGIAGTVTGAIGLNN